jgi:predicted esterase
MPRFFRRLAEGVFDLDDLVLRTHELADFVKTASVKYSLASGSVVAVGYSNGANIAASLILLHPKVLAGAVLFRPMVPLIPRELPDLSSVRILVAGGVDDRLVRRDQTEGLVNLFNRCHAHVAVHWERATHSLAEGDVHTAREWLSENFGGSAPSSQGHRI